MVDLLIAILIALGCNVSPSSTEAELKARNPGQYDRAVQIYQNQDFTIDGGGVVIVETGGDWFKSKELELNREGLNI